MLYHNEPIWHEEEIVGHITSAAYGHSLGGCIGLGYVHGLDGNPPPLDGYDIEVAGERFAADASIVPMYDPKNEKIRC